MAECKYVGCKEKVFKDGDCILHFKLPDEGDPTFNEIIDKKERAIEKKLGKKLKDGIYNFEGVQLFDLDLSKVEIKGDLNFNKSLIKNTIKLEEVTIKGRALFTNSKLGNFCLKSSHIDIIRFDKSKICSLKFSGEKDVNEFSIGIVSFDGDVEKHGVLNSISFNGGLINGDASFSGIKVHGDFEMYLTKVSRLVSVISCIIDGNVTFERVTIDENCNFNRSTIGKGVFFNIFKLYGELEFEGTKFKLSKGQENACREAKNVWERLGDRDKADKYYYREMEAKRLQKSKWDSRFEYIFIQRAFDYGINPIKVLKLWGTFVFGFGVFYLILGLFYNYFGFQIIKGIDGSLWQVPDYFYFSVFTATGFDFVHYELMPEFQFLASIEVVFGIFIWAAFLVIFARKYMR